MVGLNLWMEPPLKKNCQTQRRGSKTKAKELQSDGLTSVETSRKSPLSGLIQQRLDLASFKAGGCATSGQGMSFAKGQLLKKAHGLHCRDMTKPYETII